MGEPNEQPPGEPGSPAGRRSRRTAGRLLLRASVPVLLVLGTFALAVPFDDAGERLNGDFLADASAETPSHGVESFFAPLAAHGTWVAHPRYGFVWIPAKVPQEWRPYTLGQWLWTDRFGWVWASDEPFGWATYHYGRWGYETEYGWFWVPGDRWAPAWVTWREGDDSIGWAPIAPDGPGLAWGFPAVQRPPVTEAWVFVPSLRFAQPRLYLYALPVRETWRSLDRAPLKWSYSDAADLVDRPFDRDWLRRHNGQLDVPASTVDFVDEPAAAKRTGSMFRLFRPEIARGEEPLPVPPKLVSGPSGVKPVTIGERAVRQLAPPPPKSNLKVPKGATKPLPPHAREAQPAGP
ncbi:hypothetical protein SAMN02745172_02357 [Pseudoxanthobacter soli DSM 19599]|uniref:Uncharacterized protein n=1 Tax=Pseudoxanthobacter soli DSM 19599 TaxID=1123029 RepID=A0A1M7ZLG2_9HYPH|nr:DUF6600 domain-containing protein [Pseudoxanthobacter soli]SHO65711.1 hypothetical protein SAMN02745172_02357 [Pseudoxanthobacter soli DSM 19599]